MNSIYFLLKIEIWDNLLNSLDSKDIVKTYKSYLLLCNKIPVLPNKIINLLSYKELPNTIYLDKLGYISNEYDYLGFSIKNSDYLINLNKYLTTNLNIYCKYTPYLWVAKLKKDTGIKYYNLYVNIKATVTNLVYVDAKNKEHIIL